MNRVLLLASAVAFFAVAAMMFLVSPGGIGPLGLLLFFVLLYVLFLGLAVGICRLFFVLRSRFKPEISGAINKLSFRYGAALALMPVMFLCRGSLGSIGVTDVLTVLAIEALICFLLNRNML